MKNFFKLLLPISIVVIIAAGSWWGYKTFYKDQTTISYKTENVKKEVLTSSISASGTVEPEELINVGAQVSGKIMSFGKDIDGNTVDYRSKVKAGELLAQIDDVLYAAALREAKAQKLQAEAAITSAKATIRQAEAKLKLTGINWQRAQELYGKKAMSKSDYDTAEANYISAQADAAAAKAGLERSNAQLAIADAALIKAQRNMDYCAITSPVDGIIIDRRVSIGQTVVSNMSASSIFLIAKDLKKMEVWVSVNEADISHIKQGMKAEFSIDTFPGRIFNGTVKKVRLNATMSQNVVTYIVEVTTDNSDGTLIPYLTANVKFIRDRKNDVLTVSNAALRFKPEEKLIAPAYKDMKFADDAKIIYVLEGELLKPIEVKTGLSAAGRVELIDAPLAEGDTVVFGATEILAKKAPENQTARSPFMPKNDNKKIRGGGSAANRARANQSK